MIRNLFCITVALFAVTVRAQELGSGRLFPSTSTPASSTGGATAPGSSLDWKAKKKSEPLTTEKKIDLSGEKPKFVNLYGQQNTTVQPSGGSSQVDKAGRKSLGRIRTNLATVVLRYRDWSAVDGDKVKVSCNGVVVAKHVTLDGDFTGVALTLEKGDNIVDFKAMSSGEWGPATSEYEIVDEKGNVLLRTTWDLEELQTGSLTIERY